jgi:hypothetical protein
VNLRSERGEWSVGPIAGIIIIVLAIIGLLAVCSDDDADVDTLGRIELVDHEYDDGWGGGGSDGNSGYDGEGGRSGDYDGGPGDDCRNFCDNIIYVPGTGGGEEQPR